MDRSRKLGWGLVAAGLALAGLIQAAGPGSAPPLYDGIVLVAPYVWLDPPPGQPGGATDASTTVQVKAGRNDEVIFATDEEPPQAQVLAEPGGLTLRTGATSLAVSITPVEPVQPVPDGYIDGNVYRFTIVDQLGHPATAPASAYVSVILRAADPTLTDATIERFDGTTWKPLETAPNGESGFLVVVTGFGDFAVVGHGASPYPTPTAVPREASPPSATPASTAGPAPTTELQTQPAAPPASPGDVVSGFLIVALAGVVVVLAAVAFLILRVRRRRTRPRRRPGW